MLNPLMLIGLISLGIGLLQEMSDDKPALKTIKGPPGEKGKPGEEGKKGTKGVPGEKGKDGTIVKPSDG